MKPILNLTMLLGMRPYKLCIKIYSQCWKSVAYVTYIIDFHWLNFGI